MEADEATSTSDNSRTKTGSAVSRDEMMEETWMKKASV